MAKVKLLLVELPNTADTSVTRVVVERVIAASAVVKGIIVQSVEWWCKVHELPSAEELGRIIYAAQAKRSLVHHYACICSACETYRGQAILDALTKGKP